MKTINRVKYKFQKRRGKFCEIESKKHETVVAQNFKKKSTKNKFQSNFGF